MTRFYGLRLVVLIFCLKLILADGQHQNSSSIATNLTKECGISDVIIPRIVGGMESSLHAWPWMAVVFYKSNVVCGGAVITHKHVLTAAHCLLNLELGFKAVDFLIRLGEHDLFADSDGATPVDFTVAKIFVHEKYIGHYFDIGIVLLHKWIQFSNAIRPICLPTNDMREKTFEDMRPIIAGWGKVVYNGAFSPKLRHVQLEVLSDEACGNAYVNTPIKINSSLHLCTGNKRDVTGRDACQGDSGGPLVILVNNLWYVIGVVSFGKGCADPKFPGIFTRVTSFIDWIDETVGSL